MSGAQDRRKRLLVVGPSLSGGGAERFTSTMLCHIDRERFEPHLLLLREDVTYPLPDDVPVEVLDKHAPWHIPRTVVRLRRHIRDLRPDVVLGVMEPVSWLVSAALSGLPRPPRFVARFATSLVRALPLADRASLPVVKALLRRADVVVANSRGTGRELATWLRIPPKKVEIIWNPIDIEYVESASYETLPSDHHADGAVLIAVGRLDPIKRPDVLLDAFSQVRARFTVRLWLCGDGPMRDWIEDEIRSRGLQEDVVVLGFESNPYRWMARADVFVLTSDFEGLPNALIEAQALGLPAVSTDCPTGPADIIENGRTGLIVPTGDAEAIAEAILKLLRDSADRRTMGMEAARNAREKFDHRRILSRWESVLDPVTSSARSRYGSTDEPSDPR